MCFFFFLMFKGHNSAKNHWTGTGLGYAEQGMVLVIPYKVSLKSKNHWTETGLGYAQQGMVLVIPTKFHWNPKIIEPKQDLGMHNKA